MTPAFAGSESRRFDDRPTAADASVLFAPDLASPDGRSQRHPSKVDCDMWRLLEKRKVWFSLGVRAAGTEQRSPALPLSRSPAHAARRRRVAEFVRIRAAAVAEFARIRPLHHFPFCRGSSISRTLRAPFRESCHAPLPQSVCVHHFKPVCGMHHFARRAACTISRSPLVAISAPKSCRVHHLSRYCLSLFGSEKVHCAPFLIRPISSSKGEL
jgi:hypothetical protein